MQSVWRQHGPVVGAVATGGVLGAEARYALNLLHEPWTGFPWATLVENVTGCFLIGVLMAVLAAMTAPPALLRPFLGVGVLGGYTTFSAYAVEVYDLAARGLQWQAGLYVVGTPIVAVLATWAGAGLTRRVVQGQRGSG